MEGLYLASFRFFLNTAKCVPASDMLNAESRHIFPFPPKDTDCSFINESACQQPIRIGPDFRPPRRGSDRLHPDA